ncbi:FkbM family methyltransferase [Nocardioides sp. W3-2-3]|uniref:FkbM family methyltransferase n=1 Tax=Nocardioides convexus TaxID=2712224 RepID=UPI002418AC3C|nr:FkbM family methyltransferase [Nocardioides convexus]NHA01529.1 FkbM family methyltransferase [Nocardioides convexus]
MTALRSTGYLAKRVRQTPALFRNFPAVFADLALGRTRLARPEMTLRLRNGLTITTPNVDGARFPVYEIFADDIYRIEALTSGVDADATIVDGGGQVGCFSMALAHALPGAKVHVYEASPTSASYVRRNVTGNGFGERVTVHAKALAGEAGEFTFVDSGTASSHNGLTAPEDSGQEVTVPAVTFDDAVRDAGGSVQIVEARHRGRGVRPGPAEQAGVVARGAQGRHGVPPGHRPRRAGGSSTSSRPSAWSPSGSTRSPRPGSAPSGSTARREPGPAAAAAVLAAHQARPPVRRPGRRRRRPPHRRPGPRPAPDRLADRPGDGAPRAGRHPLPHPRAGVHPRPADAGGRAGRPPVLRRPVAAGGAGALRPRPARRAAAGPAPGDGDRGRHPRQRDQPLLGHLRLARAPGLLEPLARQGAPRRGHGRHALGPRHGRQLLPLPHRRPAPVGGRAHGARRRGPGLLGPRPRHPLREGLRRA